MYKYLFIYITLNTFMFYCIKWCIYDYSDYNKIIK